MAECVSRAVFLHAVHTTTTTMRPNRGTRVRWMVGWAHQSSGAVIFLKKIRNRLRDRRDDRNATDGSVTRARARWFGYGDGGECVRD